MPYRSLHGVIVGRARLVSQINKKTGNRLRQQLVDEVTRDPVENEDKGRGYEYSKVAYIEVDDDELDAVAVRYSRRQKSSCSSILRPQRRLGLTIPPTAARSIADEVIE